MQLMVWAVQRCGCACYLLHGSQRRRASLLRGAYDDRASRLGWVVAVVGGVMLRVVVLLVGWVVSDASGSVQIFR